jgi:hypothetical protein
MNRFSVGNRVVLNNAPDAPASTVTEITESGFKYRLDRPVPFYRGTTQEGEATDLSQWRLESHVSAQAQKA